ncbi:pyruvate dehydrogenase complex dihydrolipoyllysine-residue acetyltransferase [Acinetobacter qingfengensis]|uniref:Dihydrolipoamide acetyltransferase component of pyruvate dehydrogenase complex n=1 Tax=Acinetobacter qingfengensis TaxID=1262585 RepID=A0A1E7QWI9_9GAMM|nr:2-oxo acid dehydrogenase subunit E2 [Acinetobacter qingfengensis]KAA8731291.1 pyruvate dehydrogenase complex dihydrolipoyllysine-residue acetyltransferase [Acinetobacter qingfengensis]OEY91460.1 pyruvate dehydrogenase complex dihydrolipoyllysine-residue acetyltransferase [Acinetobacter qingfengensis]
MQITTPDIGVDKAVVAEILVKVGDHIAENDSIVLLESDKASVEVPSSASGIVKAILVNLGDDVKEGIALIELESEGAVQTASEAPANETTAEKVSSESIQDTVSESEPETAIAAATESAEIEVKVPDIGVEKALVAEILVNVGDQIDVEQSVVLVESDKASVEVPSPVAGEVLSIAVKAGDSVKEGVLLLTVKSTTAAKSQAAPAKAEALTQTPVAEKKQVPAQPQSTAALTAKMDSIDKLNDEQKAANAKVYAGPAVRQLARELGVLLAEVKASGEHGRIVKDDVFAYVKTRLNASQNTTSTTVAPAASGLPPLPDFSAFGGGEIKTMTRLQQVSVPQLSLNNFIPQVTQFDLADITNLEAWRGELKDDFKKQGIGLTILAFIAKAVAHLLKDEPYFASHLADDQKSVVLRNEIHMGIAVATPDGLTVPVLRNPDQKSIKQIAQELAELSQKARDKKLSPKDLQGANFTITSLGSIGGTAFTPLVNWPQVAILGISPATMQPVWNGKDFDPRLMLPLSLSYDHRVINGADAARFTRKLTILLKDIRNILL